jgi:hypothetical protein
LPRNPSTFVLSVMEVKKENHFSALAKKRKHKYSDMKKNNSEIKANTK